MLNLELRPPLADGMRCSTSTVEVRPVLATAAWSRIMVMTGWSWSSGLVRMREPVTTISLTEPVDAADAEAGCAFATPNEPPAARAVTARRAAPFVKPCM